MEKKSDNDNANEKSNPKGRASDLIKNESVKNLEDSNSYDNSNNNKPKYKRMSMLEIFEGQELWETAKFILNLLMTAFTILLFLIATKQTKSAQDSAKAAMDAVDISKKQFEIQNQPHIVTIPEGNRINFMPDGQIIITYKVHNTGHFPARVIKDKPVLFTYKSGASEGEVIEHFEKELSSSQEYDKDILVPNSPTLLILKSTFRDKALELEIKNGRESVLFGGETTYQDRLTNKMYKLKFAFIIKVVNWPNELVSDGVVYENSELNSPN